MRDLDQALADRCPPPAIRRCPSHGGGEAEIECRACLTYALWWYRLPFGVAIDYALYNGPVLAVVLTDGSIYEDADDRRCYDPRHCPRPPMIKGRR